MDLIHYYINGWAQLTLRLGHLSVDAKVVVIVMSAHTYESALWNSDVKEDTAITEIEINTVWIIWLARTSKFPQHDTGITNDIL